MEKGSKKISRRDFVYDAGGLMALSMFNLPVSANPAGAKTNQTAKISIRKVDSNFEREPLTPYRFKGSAITEAWQIAARLEADSGNGVVGLGTQGVLWSDSKVFAAHSESGGNALMYAMTERALEIMRGTTFTDPMQL